MCTHVATNQAQSADTEKTISLRDKPLEVTFDRPSRATDVPLGSGSADAASLAIRSRRDNLRIALGE